MEMLEGLAIEAVRHVVERGSAGAGGPGRRGVRCPRVGYGVGVDQNRVLVGGTPGVKGESFVEWDEGPWGESETW